VEPGPQSYLHRCYRASLVLGTSRLFDGTVKVQHDGVSGDIFDLLVGIDPIRKVIDIDAL